MSEYEIFWKKVETSYEKAKDRKQIIDFYLGRGSYFHRDADFGTHSTKVSFFSLKAYSKKYGNEKMLAAFKSDIESILKNDLTAEEFAFIFNYVWIYLINFYENEHSDFEIEWRVDKEIRVLLKRHLNKLEHTFPDKFTSEYLNDQYSYESIIKRFKFLKDRTGVDLLDESGNSDIRYKDLRK